MAKTVSEHNLISQVCRQLCCLSKILLASWRFRLFLSSMPIPWLVPCRHLFIPFTHWKMGRRPMRAKPIWKEGEIFFLPSLDARRTHQILPINRTVDKRSAWVRESGPSYPSPKLKAHIWYFPLTKVCGDILSQKTITFQTIISGISDSEATKTFRKDFTTKTSRLPLTSRVEMNTPLVYIAFALVIAS